jgi:uroporphyrinogen-III synthase
MKILLTRPLDGARISAARLADEGFGAVILPLLRYCPADEDSIPERTYDAVIFTSAAAPGILVGRSDFPLSSSERTPRAYCIGPATAKAAIAAGFDAAVPDRADSEGLLAKLRADMDTGRLPARPELLYICARHVSHDLASALPEANIVRTVIYEAKLIDPGHDKLAAALDAAAHGGAFLYSARTARQLAHLSQKYGLVDALCGLTLVGISEKVAQMMPKWQNGHIVVADRPDESGMIAALRAAANKGVSARIGRDE